MNEPSTHHTPISSASLTGLAWAGGALGVGIMVLWVGTAAYLAMTPQPSRFEPLPRTVTWDDVR